MVYSNLLLNNNTVNSQQVSTQAIGTNPSVQVFWNGSGIHNIAGPTPLVDISTAINNNSNGIPESVTTSINLEGKIVRYFSQNIPSLSPPTSGLSGIIGAIEKLSALFKECPYGVFEIKCDNNIIYSMSGVIVRGTNFNKTQNNWTATADYSISLETTKSVFSGGGPEQYVTDRSVSWNVEQLDDASYTFMTAPISQKSEYSNPILGATPTNIGGGTVSSTTIDIRNVPQYRVTRRVSARGLVPPESGKICGNDLSKLNSMCVRYAKTWVESQLASGVLDATTQHHEPHINVPFNTNSPKAWFYNHVRSISIDRTSYEVSDTWLAMPSGIPYTETYSLETSSGEDYIKTVRVVGNINGLNIASNEILRGSGILGTGYAPDHKIDLSAGMSLRPPESTTYQKLDDSTVVGQSSAGGGLGGGGSTTSLSIASNRYQNALSGWLYDIKPYLYRRACLAVNTPDRTLDYIAPNGTTPRPPNNPIYSKESLLSVNPVNVTEGHDPRKGTISYSVEYNNKFVIISGVVSESIDISHDVPHDNVSEIVVPGRALGPILARTGRSSQRKTININIVVVPPTGLSGTIMTNSDCPLWTGGTVYSQIREIILGHKPYVGSSLIQSRNTNGIVYTQSDNEQWNPSQGRYSRSVSWVYQQCDITKTYLDY